MAKFCFLVPDILTTKMITGMANKTSQHILGTAANLLGFCLIIISSFHIGKRAEESRIDEFVSIIALLLILSCAFSFISIKTEDTIKEHRFENIADSIFILALIGILVILSIITVRFL